MSLLNNTINRGDYDDYAAACEAATTAQGLDGIVAHLKENGVDVEVAQTGGFCMVASVYNTDNASYVGVTNEGTDDDPSYLVCHYCDVEDAEGVVLGVDLTDRDAVLALVTRRWAAASQAPIDSRIDVQEFFRGLLEAGINFHPDTRAHEYVYVGDKVGTKPTFRPEGASLYAAAMQRCFDVAARDGFDVYEVAGVVTKEVDA